MSDMKDALEKRLEVHSGGMKIAIMVVIGVALVSVLASSILIVVGVYDYLTGGSLQLVFTGLIINGLVSVLAMSVDIAEGKMRNSDAEEEQA